VSRPPRALPLLYFSVAHLSFALACAAVAYDPRGAAGFFYHARMLGLVHLVTLGWITGSILGALYLVGPIALRIWLPATKIDYTAFALYLIGVIGMIAHFWLQEYGGMAWSAATVGAGILTVGAQLLRRLKGSPLPSGVRAHLVLAFVNILGAATMGILIGFDKVYHFLPGYVISNVFAHAHLAAIGWATMMLIGIAYRRLPMVLPSAMPPTRFLWASAVLIEAGVAGLFVALLVRSALAGFFALVVVTGFGAFFAHAVWMMRHRRLAADGATSADPSAWHAAFAILCVSMAAALGVWLCFSEPSAAWLRIAVVYGVFGLVGFLAQMIVAIQGRLLPPFASYWAWANSGYQGDVVAPGEMAWREGRELVFVLWLFAVPSLAAGLAFDAIPFLRAAAWCLLAATALNAFNVIRVVRHAFAKSRARVTTL
jgi:hypothetical protein